MGGTGEKPIEKKSGRTVAIALGIICIILAVGLVGAVVNYTSIINGKDSTIATKDSQIADKDNTISSLNTSYNDYMANHHHTDAEYDSMWDPFLIEVDIKASAATPYWSWDPPSYLRVYGYVCNVNRNWAYNCKLHVVANTTLGVAIDTRIDLGTIASESWTHVDSVVYSATRNSLVRWTITPEWTSTP